MTRYRLIDLVDQFERHVRVPHLLDAEAEFYLASEVDVRQVEFEAELTRLRLVLKQAQCSHSDCCGGNDYHLCNTCHLMWDYRHETAQDVVKRLAEQIAVQQEPRPVSPERLRV